MKHISSAAIAILIITSVFAFSTSAQPLKQDTSFGNVINLSSDTGNTGFYDIASSGSNVYVVWSESVSGSNEIFFKMSKDNGASFGNVINLSKTPGNANYPKMAVSGNNVYVVWQDDSSGNKEIYFSRSTDNGATFGNVINLSNNPGESELPQIAASGNNVYVAWRDNAFRNYEILPRTYEVLFVASNNNGATFSSAANLSNNAGSSIDPRIAASGSNVYVVWQDNTIGNWEIFFRRSTNNGASFDDLVNLSNNPGNSLHPQITASGNNVYIAWLDDNNVFFRTSADNGSNFQDVIILCKSVAETICGDSGSLQVAGSGSNAYAIWSRGIAQKFDIFFSKSMDNGTSFSSALDLSNNIGNSSNARVAVSGNNVYVVWQSEVLGKANIFFRASTDNGVTFDNAVNLNSNAGKSGGPVISATGNNVYVIWVDNTPGNGQAFFRAGIIQIAPVKVSIDSVSNPKPRWDLDMVTVSGTVTNTSGAYTITVYWGDGASIPGIYSTGGKWGPVSHTYDSTHIGTNQIVAKLMDRSLEKASSIPYAVEVEKHATSLTVNTIASVEAGSDITVSGSLVDVDAKKGIGDRTVTFNGTGAEGLELVVTRSDGSFSSGGTSPTSVATNWTVQTHFAGDDLYLASYSPVQSYDTLKHAIKPTKRVQVSNVALLDQDDNKLTEVSAGEQVLVQGSLENKQNQAQSLVYVVQIKNVDGQTVFLSWIKGILQKGQSIKPAIGWIPEASGKYAIEIFVWDSLSNPQALSEVHRVELAVR